MTRSSAFTAIRSIVTIGALVSMSAGTLPSLALAGDNVSEEQMLRALQPKPLTRSLSIARPDPAVVASQTSFVETLRNRRTRSLSMGERETIAEIAVGKPNVDLDITFDYNSANISSSSLPNVQALGRVLTNPNLKGSTFMVGGHTDAVGGEGYNQDLSERRADSIKRYLTDKFGIAGSDLVTVGYGKTKPKDGTDPMDPANRRVQVVNMLNRTASN